ncbi:MAG: efflux RND transporter periplasmic adaptor subunit, partial [Bdellovibrio bacteriovorus]
PPPAPVVTVLRVQAESVPLVTELPGRTTPYLIAEVRPQVTGIIKERPFEEGSEVESGQLLYQIDPALYQTAFDSAKAALARAEANLRMAELKAKRYSGLEKSDAVSKQSNDEAVAEARQAQADVAAAAAALEKARIELDYTQVRAPIAGRIGRSAVTPGALVTANQAAALATIQQLDPIYVDLTQSSAELLRIRRQLAAGELRRGADDGLPVELVLEDGTAYGLDGTLAFSEVTVDEGTGSVTLRARFPNPEGELLPGSYVRARLPLGELAGAIRVPHAALSRDARGRAQLMVVNAEGKVEARPVETVQSLGGDWVIGSGLSSGERVIVEGLQRARPGTLVRAEEAAGPGPEAPSSGTAPSAMTTAAAR